MSEMGGGMVDGLILNAKIMRTGRMINLSFDEGGGEVDIKHYNITEDDYIFIYVEGNMPNVPLIAMRQILDGEPYNVFVPGLGRNYNVMYVTYNNQQKITLQENNVH